MEPEVLDVALRAAVSARQQTQRALCSLLAIERRGASAALESVVAQLRAASESAGSAMTAIRAAGGRCGDAVIDREALPLSLLDTPANRRYLAALSVALEAARQVDEERGWIDPDSGPCGVSEAVAALYVEARREVEGPGGRE